ncbi:MAG: hypothetical protein MUO85_06310 [candidate division Zixibacteria bacterium]|nr:hypothetical protein [candidate division Zixibacteria bacterium]
MEDKIIPITTVFDCLSGNSGLTEEFIYTKITDEGLRYEILSSSTLGTTKLGYIPECSLSNNKTLRVFERKAGILVARNGKAGQMSYLKSGNYTINDHAYILSLRGDFKRANGIKNCDDERKFLLWFICSYQSEVYEFASKTDNATWNKTDFLKMNIVIPSKEEISKVSKLYEDCLQSMERIQQILKQIDELHSKSVMTSDIMSEGEIAINKLLRYVSRNDSLSEEGIYHRLPAQNDSENIKVLSGSSENLVYGMISLNTSNIHILDRRQGLHVVSRGCAGKITFLPIGRYATNTNAFLFYLNPERKLELRITNEQEEETYLKFLRSYLQPIFSDASSESDLSVFPLTELMRNLTIPLFLYSEQMKQMVEEYNIIDDYKICLESILDSLDSLMHKYILLSSQNN